MKESERQKTLTAFQKLRRLQESDDNGYCKCICSGRIYHYKDLDGGHFIPRACKATELEPDNVWPQCRNSNKWKSGDYLTYRDRLVEKIGIERVERLENMKRASEGNEDAFNFLCDEDKRRVIAKRTDEEYRQLRKIFNADIRRLEKEKI